MILYAFLILLALLSQAPAYEPLQQVPFQVSTTHYGEQFQGSPMACGGVYDTADVSIVAVGYAYTDSIPCGTLMTLCGEAGCIDARRTDTCPGCGPGLFDLSESGQLAVCGKVGANCTVEVWLWH